MATLSVMGVALHVTEIYGNENVQSLDDFNALFLSSEFHTYLTRFQPYLSNGTSDRYASSTIVFTEERAIVQYQ